MDTARGEPIVNSLRGKLMERGEQCPGKGGGRALEAEPRADPPLGVLPWKALEPEARVSTLSNEIDTPIVIMCKRAEFDLARMFKEGSCDESPVFG